MASSEPFKLTYATMFNPPEEMHTRFDQAVEDTIGNLGKEYGMIIDGKERFTKDKFEKRSPADTDVVLGIFQKGTAQDARDAIAAARKAFPIWSHMHYQDRVKLVRRAADLIDERIFKISSVITLEVGKNRTESMGDTAESADLIRFPCSQMEEKNGFVVKMNKDPLIGYEAVNYSVLKPYGVWLVISPFNFPGALTSGPVGSTLIAGNTVVIKPSSDTPWTVRLIAECLRDAGLPDGVFNFVTGPGSTLGQALIDSEDVDGITFTGSYDVGMKIYRDFSQYKWVRPVILELGGKNPAIVSRNADLDTAATGIFRSAFGLQGQKCSACSRIFVETPVYDQLVERLVGLTGKIQIGNPTRREVFLGPVINRKSYEEFQGYCEELNQDGRFLTGGRIRSHDEFARGYFCEPTIVADLPLNHRLWKQEMFLPITTITKVENLSTAITLANDVAYGLTAGFYGTEDEGSWFLENIQSGVAYVNRPQGATTGAWPGYQPFGGWKASGAIGKSAGGPYYLQYYMHEQSQTVIRKG